MKTTIVLIALVGGVAECGNRTDPNKITQHYESMQECQEAAKFMLSLRDVQSAKCVATVEVGKEEPNQ